MRSMLCDILSTVLPRRCSACGTPLDAKERFWCISCAFIWTRHVQPGLLRFEGRLNWAHSWSWLNLRNPEEKALVHDLKYGGNPLLGVELGRAMAREWLEERTLGQTMHSEWSLVPVPLHPRRQRKRGYNQSMQLALGWSQCTDMTIAPLCVRSEAGRSFTRYNRSQRVARGNNPFSWKESASPLTPSTQGLIIIDDVVTTGSTLESMHGALRSQWPGPLAFVTLADAAR